MTGAGPVVDAFGRFRLDGRVALVTGASCRLAPGSRKRELEEQAQRLRRGLAVPCDLTDPAAVEDLVRRAIEAHGRLNILVNNAGRTDEMTPALDERREQLQQILDVNLVAPFQLAQCAARQMMGAGGGVILNVASVLGLVAHPEKPQAAYTASKGGLVNLMRELASQWGRHGVRVNARAPGLFQSEMTADSFADEDSMARIRARTPLGRAGAPEEVDGALLFLVSDASSYMTGQVLVVDGGYTAL